MKKINELKGYGDVPDYYFVSEEGEIHNIKYRRKESGDTSILLRKPNANSKPKVSLKVNGKNKQYNADEIVAAAFVPNANKKKFLINISEDDFDIKAANLKWVDIQDLCKGEKIKRIKDIEGYEDVLDIYFVTELGEFFSTRHNNPRRMKNKVSKQNGYEVAALVTETGKVKSARAHIIVAKAFLPNLENKPVVNHIDEDKANNSISNLEWASHRENNEHSLAEKIYCYTFEGELEKTYLSGYYTKEDGYNRAHVHSCCRNEIKSHKKRIFSSIPLTKEEVVQRLSKPYYLNGDKRYKSNERE